MATALRKRLPRAARARRRPYERDVRDLRRALDRALAEQEKRARKRRIEVLDVQLVLQVVRDSGYGSFRAGWTKAWTDEPYSTASWPKKLADSQHGALLLPLPAGRVGNAVGRYPALAAEPIFGTGTPVAGRGVEDLLRGLLVHWISNPADGHAARLAPPVIERIGARGVLERTVERFGVEWPLPTADGV
jgi:hypothetical protein